MRIAFFSDTFLPQINGVVTTVINYSKFLASRGHKIIIIAPKPKIKKNINLGSNIIIKYITSIDFPTYKEYRIAIPTFISILQSLYKFKPDIIHIHSPFSIGWQGIVSSKVFNLPLIGTYHTIFPEFLEYIPVRTIKKKDSVEKIVWRTTNFIYNNCDLITSPSVAVKNLLIKNGIKKPVKVISNGIDLSKYQTKKISKETKNIINKKFTNIIYFGRISYEKNIGILLKAMKLVLNKQKKVKLIIVGSGPQLHELIKKSKELKISNNVIFTGFVKDKILFELLSSADIFTTASTSENQSLTILEAMASGLPLIGANSLGIPELICNGKNGYLFEPNNYEELANKLLKLIQNEKLRNRFGNNSRKFVKKYSLDNVIIKLEKLYTKEINRYSNS